MTESYSAHKQKVNEKEELEHLLNVSNYLKNNKISKKNNYTEFGVIKKSNLENKTSKILQKWERTVTPLEVEIVSLNHRPLYQNLKENGKNPDLTVSVPIVFQQDNERFPAFLIVRRL